MISFAEISERAILKGDVAIGYRIGGKTVKKLCHVLHAFHLQNLSVKFISLYFVTTQMSSFQVINPCSKDDLLSFTVGDSLVVISEFQYSSKGL